MIYNLELTEEEINYIYNNILGIELSNHDIEMEILKKIKKVKDGNKKSQS